MKRKVRVYAPCLSCGGSYKEQGGDYLPVVDTDRLHQVAFGGMDPDYKSGGNWIPGNLKKGRCTPAPNPDCPKGSPQYNLAMTFKKHHGFHEKGGSTLAPQNTSIDDFGKNRIDYMKSYLSENTRRKMAEEMLNEYYANPYAMPMNDSPQMYDTGGEDSEILSNIPEWLQYGYDQRKAAMLKQKIDAITKKPNFSTDWDAFQTALKKPREIKEWRTLIKVEPGSIYEKQLMEEDARLKAEQQQQKADWRNLSWKEKREQRREDREFGYSPYTYYFQDGGDLPKFQTKGSVTPYWNPYVDFDYMHQMTSPTGIIAEEVSKPAFLTTSEGEPLYNGIPISHYKIENYNERDKYMYGETIPGQQRTRFKYQIERPGTKRVDKDLNEYTLSPTTSTKYILDDNPDFKRIKQLQEEWEKNKPKKEATILGIPYSQFAQHAANQAKQVTPAQTKTGTTKPGVKATGTGTGAKSTVTPNTSSAITTQDVATYANTKQNEKAVDVNEKGNVTEPGTETGNIGNTGTGASKTAKDYGWDPYTGKMSIKYRGFPYGRGRIKNVVFDLYNNSEWIEEQKQRAANSNIVTSEYMGPITEEEWLRQQKQRAVNANVVNVSSQYPELQGKSPLKPGYTPYPELQGKSPLKPGYTPTWHPPIYQKGSEYMGPITEEEWLRQQENNPFLSAVNPYVQPKSNDNYIEPITFGDAAKYNFNSGINTIPTIDRLPIKQYNSIYNTESQLKKIDNPYLDDPQTTKEAYDKFAQVTMTPKYRGNKQAWKTGIDLALDYATYLGNRRTGPKEKDLAKLTGADNVFTSIDGNRGDIGFGPDIPFRANQYTPVQFTGRGMAKWGGQKYKEGGSYDLTQSEIQAILNAGGEIEYI